MDGIGYGARRNAMPRWESNKTSSERGYGYQWQKLRKNILARDDYLCVMCLQRGILTPATDVDHIVQKADGGTDDWDNLQSLCKDCHKDKTVRDNGGIPRTGCSLTGEPVDSNDPWFK